MSGLLEFAKSNPGLILDNSRTSFFELNEKLLIDLEKGNLKHINRFRQLLLGVKSVGKTRVLKVIKSFMDNRKSKIITIYRNYDSSYKIDILSEIQNILTTKYSLKFSYSSLNESEMVEELEEILIRNDLFLLLLIDEFQFVYNFGDIGKRIVSGISNLVGSDQGRIHMIVSGSSSKLRKLVFAIIPKDFIHEYDSYEGKDLNSTKLQPRWIFPINNFELFSKLVASYPKESHAIRYICSGGRPGLINIDRIEDIPYSLSLKSYGKDNNIESLILKCLAECLQVVIDEASNFDLESLSRFISPINEDLLRMNLMEKCPDFTQINNSYTEAIFNLSDDGIIIVENRDISRFISLSGVFLFFCLKTNNELTWKEAAALKMPKSLFDKLAEETSIEIPSIRLA